MYIQIKASRLMIYALSIRMYTLAGKRTFIIHRCMSQCDHTNVRVRFERDTVLNQHKSKYTVPNAPTF